MRRKPFSEMESIDDEIRQAFLEAHDGEPPDIFVEDGQGGAIDRKFLTKQTPASKQALRRGLQQQLKEADEDAYERAKDSLWD